MPLPSLNKEKMGELFRGKRKELGLRQEDVANKAGLSISTVSNIELGNHRVKEENLISYAEVIGIEEDIFGLLSESKKKEQKVKQELLTIEMIIPADPDEALRKLNRLNKSFDLENSKTLSPFSYYLWGKSYFEKKKWVQAERYLQDAIIMIEEQIEENIELKNSNILAGCLNDFARITFFQNDFKKALQFVEKGLETFCDAGDRLYFKYFLSLNRCVYLEKISDKLNNQERLVEALEQLQEDISEIEKTENMFQHVRLSIIIQYYDMYANVWNKMGMTERALEYAKKGINIAWLNFEFDRLLTLWNTTGTIFLNRGNILTAKEYFLRALDIQSKIKREYLLIPAYMNLGMLYLRENDPDTASKYLERALQFSQKNNDVIGQMKALQAIGHVYFVQNSYAKAISQFEKGYSLAKKHELLYRELEIMDDICSCYKELGNKEIFLACVEKTYLIRQQIKAKEEGGVFIDS